MDLRAIDQRRTRVRGPAAVLMIVAALVLGLLGVLPVGAQSGEAAIASLSPNQVTIQSGQRQSFTITVKNDNGEAHSVNVMAELPSQLKYVAGSASNGGTATGQGDVQWSNINVPARSQVELRFSVTPNGTVGSESTVRILALVSGTLGIVTIPGLVTLVPGSGAPPDSDFDGSTMTVSPDVIGKDQQATYTIVLRNGGNSAASANVVATYDQRLGLVSSSPTGSHNASSRQVSWSGVNVPAGGSATLSFVVRLDTFLQVPSPANTRATVTAGGASFDLSASLLLTSLPVTVPPPALEPLAGSVKLVSRGMLGPGEEATYTILLNNSGTSMVEADVSDVLPAGLSYVAGSASNGGSYNNATRTLSWEGLEVSAGGSVSLQFRVTAATAVASNQTIVNKVTITSGGKSFERRSPPLVLTPNAPPPGSDVERPEVTSVAIAGGDVQTDRDVTINIAATDNVGVVKMQVQEWVLDRSARPRWRVVQQSGLIDYQTSLPWTLTERAGTHYIGVWAQDAAGNYSVLDRGDIDFASLLLPNSSVGQREATPYLVHLEQGQSVSAAVSTSAGDADLYIWYPGGFGRPDKRSIVEGTGVDSLSFSAPTTGTYIFLVYGFERATYSLSINGASTAGIAANLDAETAAKGEGLLAEPLLSVAGLDPLATVAREDGQPVTPSIRLHLPALRR